MTTSTSEHPATRPRPQPPAPWERVTRQQVAPNAETAVDVAIALGVGLSDRRTGWIEQQSGRVLVTVSGIVDASRQSGAALIARERSRQIAEEGYTPEFDRAYEGLQLTWAALAYVENAIQHVLEPKSGWLNETDPVPAYWPWSVETWKPNGYIDDLVRAGALLAAELDRILAVESIRDGES